MEDEQKKIQELQFLEQNMQNILMQKQAFEMELSESQAALIELENSGEEVYKIIGQLMIRGEKSKVKAELLNKEKIIKLRLTSFEKQEASLTEQRDSLRDEMIKSSEKKAEE